MDKLRCFDRAFAISLLTFGLGTVTGFLLADLVPSFRAAMIRLLQVRVLGPVEGALMIGGFAVVVLIFANNAVPVLSSFLYPILLVRIHWTPPLTRRSSELLLTGYSLLVAYLLGFFDLGGSLGSVFFERGGSVLLMLLGHSWMHGPIEFTLILLCVAEPARIAARQDFTVLPYDRKDLALLLICLLGLLFSAILEYGLGV